MLKQQMTFLRRIRVKSWSEIKRLPPDTVYVGRSPAGTITDDYPFGNPYKVGRDGTLRQVIDLYREYLAGQPELVARIKKELRGKNLACWCAAFEPCHADIILEIANEVC